MLGFVALGATAVVGCSGDEGGDDGPSAGTGGAGTSTGGKAGGGAGNPTGGSPGALAYKPCDEAQRLGGFEVNLKSGAVQGQVLNGVVPSRVPLEIDTEGECRLLQGKNLFCDPACTSSQTCGDAGSCVPTPLGQNVGAVVVSGVRTTAGASEITLEPTGSNFYSTRATLAEPPFEPQAAVTLTAAGSAFASAFSLRGEGISPLEVPDEPITVQAGTALPLRWAAPTNATAAKLEIRLQFNLHGSTTAAFIVCDVADDGSFDVPSGLVDELLSRELSGFPTVVLTRKTADSIAAGPGCIDFSVASQVSRALEVPGITSCNEDGDCEPGQVCIHPQLVCE